MLAKNFSRVFGIVFLPLVLIMASCSLHSPLSGTIGESSESGSPTPTPTPSVSSFAVQLGATAVVPGGNTSLYDYCFSTAVDSSGNVYCAGGTQGALGEANGGSYDAFVMKLNSSGVVQWIRQLGSVTAVSGGSTAAYDSCWSVAVDSSGNVYCAGSTNSALGEANGGGYDAFVVKLDSSGVVQWIRQLGSVTSGANSSSGDHCNGVAVDSSGNVYCAGSTDSALGETAGGLGDAFVMKLNSSGVVQWIRQLGSVTSGANSSSGDRCNGVAVDSSGNVYCAGDTAGALGEANGGGGNTDAFVMKLNSSGVVQWIRQLGAVTVVAGGNTSAGDFCSGVAVDSSGNVYCAGATGGALGEANGGGGNTDAFVMKLNSSGAVQWIRQLGAVTTVAGGDTSSSDRCNGVALDDSGNIYCAGDTGAALGEANGGGGNTDALVMKLNSSGVVQWIRQFGATTKASAAGDNSYYETFLGVAVDSSGNVYAAGEADGSVADTDGGGNSGDVYVVKVSADGSFSY